MPVRFYANGENFAYWLNGTMHFQHNDYLGTVHARSFDYGATNGDAMAAREGTYYSLPWGDGKSYTAGNQSPGGTDDSNAHYAELEHDQLDIYSDTDQALNRTYVAAQGSWLQPDPYDGSYDSSDPQSFNRYAYARNNPLMLGDPTGLDPCPPGTPAEVTVCVTTAITITTASNAAAAVLTTISPYIAGAIAPVPTGKWVGWWGRPQCPTCLTPRPENAHIGCSTSLPDGRTVGDVVRQQRKRLLDAANAAGEHGARLTPGPLAKTMNAFYPIAQTKGPIDLKLNFPKADLTTMGLAGNFAYYAIAAHIIPYTILDAGAGYYAVGAAFTPGTTVAASDLTGPFFSDSAAASQREAGLAANGCAR